MNARELRVSLRIFWSLLLMSATALGQGVLTPPGPPGPTMKTLTQVEPRTLISSIPYAITNPGSYYLTGDLTGTPAQGGIVISVSGVTIDLNGFVVSGSSNGIIASGTGLEGVVIRNGTVRNCPSAGIVLNNVKKCQIEHVLACNNGILGMAVGSGSIIDLCTVTGNNGFGISVDESSAVFNCVVQSNTADGIFATGWCRVSANTCDSNGSGSNNAAIHIVGNGGRVEGNQVSRNNANGIQVDGANNLVIQNSACGSAVADYVIMAGNNYGQILTGPGAGFTNSNPWANFSCTAPASTNCTMDADCAGLNTECSTGVCTAGTCGTTPKPDGTACTGGTCSSGACRPAAGPCASAGDCPPTGNPCAVPICQAGVCGTQNVPDGTTCPGGTCMSGTCQGANTCFDGVKDGNETDIDCGGGTCVPCPNGKNCAAGSDCASGICSGGVCQPLCTGTQVNCGGVCADLASDPSHCGNCGTVCPSGASCVSGVCTCPSGQVNCGGGCVSLATNAQNCGSCGTVCPSGASCVASICTCPSGQASCGGACVSLATDVNNCGNCSHVCPSGHSCVAGVCN